MDEWETIAIGEPITTNTVADSPISGGDEWETIATGPEVAPQTGGEVMAGGIGSILNGLTWGIGDEIVGAGAGTVDYLGNRIASVFSPDVDTSKGLFDYVTDKTTQAEDLREGFQREHPFVGGLAEISGALQNPMQLGRYLKPTTLAGKIALPTVDTAIQSGLFGFGDAENGKRLEGAMEGVTSGSRYGLGVGLASQFAPMLGDAAKRTYLGAMGITANDAKRIPGKAAEVVDELRQSGAFKEGLDPESVKNTIGDQVAKKYEQINDIISTADKSGVASFPNFDKTRDAISSLKGTEKKAAMDAFQAEVEGLIDTLDNGGTLQDWQLAKQSLHEQLENSYVKQNPGVKEWVKQKIASDLRQHIEDTADILIPNQAGVIKETNKEIGKRLSLKKPLQRAIDREDAASPLKSIIGAIKTTGGIGVPILVANNQSDNPLSPIIAGMLGGGLMSRRGQFLAGDAMRGMSSGLESPSLSTLVSSLTRGSDDESNPTLSSFDLSGVNIPTPTPEPTITGEEFSLPKEVTGESMTKPDETFLPKVEDISANLGIDPQDLLAVMSFETGGSLDSAEKNRAGSGATGLIQFMPTTAKNLTGAKTKEAALEIMASMTPTEQLDYVEKYLSPFKGKLKTLEDLYMAVLWPKAIGKDSSYALFREGTKAFAQNAGLDINDDGIVTKAEAAHKVKQFKV